MEDRQGEFLASPEPLAGDGRHRLPLRVVAEYRRLGPSRQSAEPVAIVLYEWTSAAEPPDAQDLLQRVARLWRHLDWAPDVPLEDTPLATLGRAIALLARYLLNMYRGQVETAGKRSMRGNRIAVFVGMHDWRTARDAIHLATDLLGAAMAPVPPEEGARLQEALMQLRANCHRLHPDYITRILMLAARQHGIPVVRKPGRMWQYGWGAHGRTFREAACDADGYVGSKLTTDKAGTTALLHALGLPATVQALAQTREEALERAASLGFDIVVKPVFEGQGRGVTVGVGNAAELGRAFDAAAAFGLPVLLEQRVPGHDHRLLVVGSKLVAASRRDPPCVTGDGKSTVDALVKALNSRRRSDPVTRRYLKTIKFDDAVLAHLASQGLDRGSVPAAGRPVALRSNANVSTGGTAVDVLHLVHAEVRAMAETIAAAFGMHACGIDYITPDISRPWREAGGAVIELNALPGLDVHVAAGCDEIALGEAVLGPGTWRIPLVLVIGQAAGLQALASRFPALEIGSGFGFAAPGVMTVDGMVLAAPGDAHARSTQLLLNPRCRVAVLACLATEVADTGLPVDHADLLLKVGLDGGDAAVRETEAILDARKPAARTVDVDVGRALVELGAFIANPPAPPQPTAPVKRDPALPAGCTWLKRHRATAGPTLFALMRDEAYLLPHFLQHYRSLGVENFIIYDDNSTDGSRELLERENDCSIVQSGWRFDQAMPDGRKLQHALKELLPESLGPGRWVLGVDVDEFLVLPGRFTSVADFQQALDRRGFDCVFGTMVDAYPATLAQRNYAPALSPFEGSPYFDIERGFRRQLHTPAPEKVLASVRGRLINRLRQADPAAWRKIFAGVGYLMPALSKVPFVKTGCGITRNNSHVVNRQPPFGVEVALAHFKFGPDLDGKIAQAIQGGHHYLGSIEYRFLRAAVRALGNEDLRYPGTRDLREPLALEAAGFTRFDG
ncbi:MAG: glycosyltransferase family 2 protein [Burkholderiales bacterium]|nr:glycosyltransferase family 2 protein [Burkholderiales bacterium]